MNPVARSKMAENIDVEFLISLVESRPVLWDKTLESYKDRNVTKNAWREILLEVKPDFEELEDKEKNTFGKLHFYFILHVKYYTLIRDLKWG